MEKTVNHPFKETKFRARTWQFLYTEVQKDSQDWALNLHTGKVRGIFYSKLKRRRKKKSSLAGHSKLYAEL